MPFYRDQDPAIRYIAQKRFDQKQYDINQGLLILAALTVNIIAAAVFFLIV